MTVVTYTQATYVLLCVIFVRGIGASKVSPFLQRSEALQMLSSGDLGRSKALTAQLGLRADIGDGWEELLTGVPSQDKTISVESQVDIVIKNNWIDGHDLRYLAEKIVFRSPKPLNALSYHHLLSPLQAYKNLPSQLAARPFS